MSNHDEADLDILVSALDGACGVEMDVDIGIAIVWHGGAAYNVYTLPDWSAVESFTRYGDEQGNPLDGQGARAEMRAHLVEMGNEG